MIVEEIPVIKYGTIQRLRNEFIPNGLVILCILFDGYLQ